MSKKINTLLSSLLITSTAVCPILTSCSKPGPSEYHIMHISDIHGEIPGYGDDYFNVNKNYAGAIRMADAMQEIVNKSKASLILAGGDQNSSGTFSAPTKGKSMYPVLSAMDISYSAVGNHAWDWGAQPLEDQQYDMLGRTSHTEGNYFISANILKNSALREHEWFYDESDVTKFEADFELWNSNRVAWADPYKIVNLDNHKICLIGLTTIETLIDGNQKELADYAFSTYIPTIHYAKHLLKKTEGEETFNSIESFIVLAHAGASIDEQKYIGGEMSELANMLDTPIDAILAGHTHSSICGRVYNNKFDKPVWIAETSPHMQDFTDAQFFFDDSKPVGQRLKEIKIQLVSPKIDNESQEAAHAQLEKIIANPRNQVVQKTADTYSIQKDLVKAALSKVLGTSKSGLSYLQKDYLFDYKYPCDIDPETKKDVLVEQAGSFVAKAEIANFNKRFAKDDTVKKANICYIGNSSIHDDINSGDVTLKDLYGLYPYDNYAVTASLTYYQLKQIASYMLTGATLDTETRIHGKYCTDEYKFTPSSESFVIQQLRYPYGPNQFYGFCFTVENAESEDKQNRKYALTTDESTEYQLKVYDPDNTDCKIDDPSTWKGESYWMDTEGGVLKYITVVMSNFDFYRGNNQNIMIYDFAAYNALEKAGSPELQIREFTSIDPRDLTTEYIQDLTTEGKTVDFSDDICKQLIQFNKEAK